MTRTPFLRRFFHADPQATPDWPQRPWVLAGIGAVAGLSIHLLTAGGAEGPAVALRGAAVWFVGLGAILFAFAFERSRPAWGLAFALGAAGLAALVSLLLGGPLAWWDQLWRLLCILLAVAIAAPLFQTARDAGRAVFTYDEVHDHAWTNVLLAAAGAGFTGIVFATLLLLGGLFRLIGIGALFDLVTEPWFAATLAGATSLGAVGWLRERVGVMRGTIGILALLAPVMGAGLVLFLAALPFTGIGALWEATQSTTPILVGCIAGGLVIANAVIGSGRDAPRPPAMRWGALAIALALFPLALIAVASVSVRIDAYGLTPERIWAAIIVAIASAYGLGYLVAVARGRAKWAARVRDANLRLSVGLGAIALLLALPILNFDALSARDQLARIESGRTPPDRADLAALRFQMGEPGRAALTRLARTGPAPLREPAVRALAAQQPWLLGDVMRPRVAPRVLPVAVPLPPGLIEAIEANGRFGPSVVVHQAGTSAALLLAPGCERCPVAVTRYRLGDGAWREVNDRFPPPVAGDRLPRGRIELRTVERRQLFVDGAPVGEPFE